MTTIKNFDALATTPLRRDALEIAEAGYEAIKTRPALEAAVRIEGDTLIVKEERYTLTPNGKLLFVGVGKCSDAGAMAIEKICGERLTGGIALDVSFSETCKATLQKIECFNGTHPSPSEANVAATAHILSMLAGLNTDDTVIFLISGGGSTLLCSPVSGTCTEEAELLHALFNAGATIQEINTIRKHASLARGGFLAEAAHPAQVIGLIFSDVPGNDIEFIASGPTVKDITTVDDARALLAKYAITIDPHMLIETPKEERFFERIHNILIVSNDSALVAMKQKAEEKGYHAEIITDVLTGEAAEVARTLVANVHTAPTKTVHLYGGETTVTITGEAGKGGRNQEMALAGLRDIAAGEILLTIASDGRDNSDCAGALCDTLVRDAATAAGVSIENHLRTHSSYDFWQKINAGLITGETESNVSDLIVVMKE